MCNHFQDATQVPLPPKQIIGSHKSHLQTHKEPTILHVSHDPSYHENPPSNMPYENMKNRRNNKYVASSQEVAHFEL